MTQAQHHWVVDVDGENRLLYQNSVGEIQYDPPSNLYTGKLGVPEGYLPVKSAEGILYYLNVATMATTWTKPTEPAANDAVSTKTQSIFSLIDPRLLHPEHEPLFFLPPPKEALPPLPPQWENHFDSSTGLEYYYNKKTKKSTWERPTKLNPATIEDIDSAPPLTLTCPRCHTVFHERDVFLHHLKTNLHASGHSCDFHEA